ncbi:MAG TPA: hypothetical protein VGX25_21915 [Actinophytocola sp.]|uniref:hypothetical protein n=1 Tax=Actinophytocola sp. TaxID=1872138 RepID=UPI002DDCE7F2|nr:hypothetical protein [Actinophytocola sp.]HEV2782056.1 hypothetical protein [Actinophytocola sp.]
MHRDRPVDRPCWANDAHAEAALGSSELLRVAKDWTVGSWPFEPRQGLRPGPLFHQGWRTLYAPAEVTRLVALFHTGQLPA